MATDTSRLQATVEDYFSDDGHGNGIQIDAFTPDPSPSKANVRTRRSNPEEMGTDKTPTGKVPNNCDVKSDSGYSSQSVAGLSSADSAASAPSSQRSPPVIPAKAVPAAPSPTPAQRAPRPPHQRQQSTQSSQSAPRPPPSRRDSQASQASRRPPATERPERSERSERRPTITHPAPKRRDSQRVDKDECTVPGCTKCGPDAIESRPRRSRRQSMLNTQPAESAPDVSYPHPYDTRSQISDPAQYQASSPREGRQPRYYAQQGGPVVQPAISRRLSVNSRQARPTSYHGDPNYNYQQHGMQSSHPSSPHEHGPPPSRSAGYGMPYGQPQMNSPYMPQYPTQNQPPAAFYQALKMQPQPMYEQPRPTLQPRASTSSGHPAPFLVQASRSDRHMPSPRYHHHPAPQAPAQRQQPRVEYRDQEEDDESESESESETESEEEYGQDFRQPAQRIMAPPESRPQKGSSRRRPSLRHANTTPAPPAPESKARRPQTVVVPERPRPERRDSRVRDRLHDPRPDRRGSVSRPPLVPSIKSQSAYDTPQARVIVEGSRSSRRESLQAYDRPLKEHRRPRQQEYNEQRRRNRSSKVYDNAVDYERDFYDDEEEAAPPLRRRGTDADSRRRPHRPVEVNQAADAEDYINARRGDRETYADQTYEIAKKRSSRTSGPSEAESSRSRGSNENGEIRLRIGNDAPVTLSLNGDMEGRTLQLVPIDDRMNELVISSNGRGGESVYRSERGSTRGERKAIMPASQARREAEEMTERSSRSSRSRRDSRIVDEPRHILQRRPRREERGETQYRS